MGVDATFPPGMLCPVRPAGLEAYAGTVNWATQHSLNAVWCYGAGLHVCRHGWKLGLGREGT